MLGYKLTSTDMGAVDTLRGIVLAAGLPVEVGRLINLEGAACDISLYSGNQTEFGLTLMTQRLGAKAIRGFSVWLGAGCEALFLGLAANENGILGWEGACATYGEKTPSLEVFEHRHVTAVKILDLTVKSGIKANIQDYSGYWESRDLAKLRAAAHDVDAVKKMLDAHRGDPLVDMMRKMSGGQFDERPV